MFFFREYSRNFPGILGGIRKIPDISESFRTTWFRKGQETCGNCFTDRKMPFGGACGALEAKIRKTRFWKLGRGKNPGIFKSLKKHCTHRLGTDWNWGRWIDYTLKFWQRIRFSKWINIDEIRLNTPLWISFDGYLPTKRRKSVFWVSPLCALDKWAWKSRKLHFWVGSLTPKSCRGDWNITRDL